MEISPAMGCCLQLGLWAFKGREPGVDGLLPGSRGTWRMVAHPGHDAFNDDSHGMCRMDAVSSSGGPVLQEEAMGAVWKHSPYNPCSG